MTIGDAGESGRAGAGLCDLSSSEAWLGAWLELRGKWREKGNWGKWGNREPV